MRYKPIIILITLLPVLYTACNHPKTDVLSHKPETDTLAPAHQYAYGIVIDSLILHTGIIQKNQSLADILLPFQVSYARIDHIARNSAPLFDVKKIRAGAQYALLYTPDSLSQVHYFIYENNPVEYTVFDLRDSLRVYRSAHPTDTLLTYAAGTIQSSLWNTMVDAGADPMLAVELSEIYAWTIDFFGIQKGDGIEVLYEKVFKGDEYIGLGSVIAAEITHMGHSFPCYRFQQQEEFDYYDENGGSMRRTFLKAPLRYSRVSSGFSYARKHPILKITRPHLGIDYAAAEGTPVYTIGDGVVIGKGYERNGGGNYLKIKHNGTYTTVYMHLKGYAKGIQKGMKVKQGQLIGYVGKTGLATGPHLDFRVYRNGHAMNPNNLQAPPAKPVDSLYLDNYRNTLEKISRTMEEYRNAYHTNPTPLLTYEEQQRKKE